MAGAGGPVVRPLYNAEFDRFVDDARDLRGVLFGDTKALAQRAVGQSAVVVHIAKHGMLVTAAHTLLPRELAERLAPKNDDLRAGIVGAEIRRR